MLRNGKGNRRGYTWYWYLPVLVACLALLFILFSSSRSQKQTEETVTIDSSSRAAIPAGTPVAEKRTLPVQDPEVENAGDHIAEATVYLKRKQSAAALRALHQAQAATNHAISLREPNESGGNKELLLTLNELGAIERAIQRGQLEEAVRQLNALNRRLDALAH
ncbi:MAG: hypothetical protein JOZ52_06840 [Acidobacteria bacterium]|nr:hypothetical protein [Acidobacteriota bacterium]